MTIGRVAALLFAPIALAVVALGWLGYLGGDPFAGFPARARPATAERGMTALFLSSDMGLRVGMAPRLIGDLAEDGIPVVAVNSLTYFRTRRSPAETKALVEEGIRRALAKPGTRRLLLIGQSFGADMLQAGLARLPAELRARVAMVVLIVPPDTTMYRASPSEIFDFGQVGIPAMATAGRLVWAPTLCVQGHDESDSLCPRLNSPNVARVVLPGGHMLGFDADRLYAAIAPWIRANASGEALHYR